MVNPLLSVVVCTADRCTLLSGVLETLAEQTAAGAFEVLVVDNGSRELCQHTADQFVDRLPGLRYVREKKSGLSHARNLGWIEARGSYVAYVDDDCRIPPTWAATAIELITTRAPAVLGGGYRPLYEIPKPRWFKDSYGSEDLGPSARVVRPSEFLSGGNLIVRRDDLVGVGGFNPRLGMTGRRLGLGEEVALQAELRAARPEAEVYYDPRLYVLHLVHPFKYRLAYTWRRQFAAGVSDAHRLQDRFTSPAGERLAAGAKALAATALALFDLARCPFRDREIYPHWENYLYEHTSRYIGAMGVYWGVLRS